MLLFHCVVLCGVSLVEVLYSSLSNWARILLLLLILPLLLLLPLLIWWEGISKGFLSLQILLLVLLDLTPYKYYI